MGVGAALVGGSLLSSAINKRGQDKATAAQLQSNREALAATEAATNKGLGFLQPFSSVGQQGLNQASFLTDPNQQFQFLQNNPLFDLALQNADRNTQNMAAANSRLSAGDTLQQLSNNVLLSASPLIQDQKRSIGDLLNFGAGIAQTQANTAINQGTNAGNLIQSRGDISAAGSIAGANNKNQLLNNLFSAGTLSGAIKLPG